ncbi:hypothetical protein SODALDRAFT_274260 [Sodiomyces alkalinus F11]|uniref:Zn(2)-C6 fungal-type domain-containing protein n=1 Tax=Sodiomyces alkalinus (strain CBS 110278 / VKM F-3762 / F11) TaxID=1314773 RepID=A0A3N2PZ84_SODAK|nr:hypothetical protein SODALDRAFT_274260 [Sodiomyces alkalinus F11]ROT39814.1 hypothetical protein SODALDRAFT_274260 [Sodiomyces alkalinus F11]
MDVEPSSVASNSVGSGGPPNQRKERGAIAAQACETCRSRKQKCDEQRPKCGTCQRFKLDCRYREPQPTKKDKTLVEILDRLRLIEGKVDSLGRHGIPVYESSQPIRPDARPSTVVTGSSGDSVPTTSSILTPSTHQSGRASPTRRPSPYRYVSAVHKLMAWPVVHQMLDSARPEIPNLHGVISDKDPPSGILEQHMSRRKLPTEGLESMTMDERALLGLHLDAHQATSNFQLADLDWATMQNLTKVYFDTFNFMYPIMDRQSFTNDALTKVFNDGFDDGVESTLVCLVFALGEVAIADTQGIPITSYKGRPGGVKGGTVERPPGLAFFNEGRKRMGFSVTDCTLENVQIHALAGLYLGSCSRHLELWRMTISASMAYHALITRCLNLELELPLTGLEKLEETVGLPDFSGPFCEEDYLGNQQSRFQEHFASQIVLRRLCVGFHNTLQNAIGPTTTVNITSLPSPEQTSEPVSRSSSVLVTVKQLAHQLEQWRGMLPEYLRWDDTRATAFSAPVPDLFSPAPGMYPPPPIHDMFTPDLSRPPVPHPYATDIQVALLRTRYYYTKYLIYRPFVYKALHHANMIDTEDAKGVAECFKACLKWPIIMSPTCYRKRLIPCLFFWIHNLLGVLILLHLSQRVPILSNIRSQFCDESFDLDATQTVNLCIDWIRDLKSVDPAAEWSWNVLRSLYHLDD